MVWVHTWIWGGRRDVSLFFPNVDFVPHKNKKLIISVLCPEWSFHPILLHYVFESISKPLTVTHVQTESSVVGGEALAVLHSAPAASCVSNLNQPGCVNCWYWCHINASYTTMHLEPRTALSCRVFHSSSTAAFATANLSTGYQQNLLDAFTQF